MSVLEHTEAKRRAEVWALADDEHMLHLLVWQRVKKRAEAGGFNGVVISDYVKAREAMTILLPPSAAKDRVTQPEERAS